MSKRNICQGWFFPLRFVSACVCSDLDLCHVCELGSRQMGLVLGCADVVEIIFGTNNLTGVIDIDIKIEIERSWGLCASCQVGPRCQHLDDSVIATALRTYHHHHHHHHHHPGHNINRHHFMRFVFVTKSSNKLPHPIMIETDMCSKPKSWFIISITKTIWNHKS